MNLEAGLKSGIVELGLSLSDNQVGQLLEYLELLIKWNRHYNLTAITDPEKMLSYHLLDSLSISKYIANSDKVLDVGSGAGLPGIPLAIALPGSSWMLLDSNGKKTRFMLQAIALCGIDNAQVVKCRVEGYHAPEPFDVVVSRAYASLANYCQSVAHLVENRTRLMTMKTGLDAQEAEALDSRYYELHETHLKVPGIAGKRSLVIINKKT
ncbi:MAG: 16S rRNA (guanine(527)-N(7))-methyltransferase RsmG [Gammaproteobacteria bacterium]